MFFFYLLYETQVFLRNFVSLDIFGKIYFKVWFLFSAAHE